jgi:hypothetical protein
VLLKLFNKITREGNILNLIYTASITQIPPQDEDITKRKLYIIFLGEHSCKTPQKTLAKCTMAKVASF